MNRSSAFSFILAIWIGAALAATVVVAWQARTQVYGSAAASASVLLGAQFIIPLWIVFEKFFLLQTVDSTVDRRVFGWCLTLSSIYVVWVLLWLCLQGFHAPHGKIEDPLWVSVQNLIPNGHQSEHNLIYQAYLDHGALAKVIEVCGFMPLVPAILITPIAKFLSILFPSA